MVPPSLCLQRPCYLYRNNSWLISPNWLKNIYLYLTAAHAAPVAQQSAPKVSTSHQAGGHFYGGAASSMRRLGERGAVRAHFFPSVLGQSKRKQPRTFSRHQNITTHPKPGLNYRVRPGASLLNRTLYGLYHGEFDDQTTREVDWLPSETIEAGRSVLWN